MITTVLWWIFTAYFCASLVGVIVGNIVHLISKIRCIRKGNNKGVCRDFRCPWFPLCDNHKGEDTEKVKRLIDKWQKNQ